MPSKILKRSLDTVEIEQPIEPDKMDGQFVKALDATIARQEMKQEESEEKVWNPIMLISFGVSQRPSGALRKE